jgi:hypothetical protein
MQSNGYFNHPSYRLTTDMIPLKYQYFLEVAPVSGHLTHACFHVNPGVIENFRHPA